MASHAPPMAIGRKVQGLCTVFWISLPSGDQALSVETPLAETPNWLGRDVRACKLFVSLRSDAVCIGGFICTRDSPEVPH